MPPYLGPLSSSLNLASCRPLCRAPVCTPSTSPGVGLSSITETIELLVSELTTNSVRAMAGHDGQPTIRLRLFTDSARVRTEVWDADPRPSAPKDAAGDGMPDLEAEGGRGLFLVSALSTRWAWCATQEPAGKVTWYELDLASWSPHL